MLASPKGGLLLTIPRAVLLAALMPLGLRHPSLSHTKVESSTTSTAGFRSRSFAEQNFFRQPGCDGLEIDCATD